MLRNCVGPILSNFWSLRYDDTFLQSGFCMKQFTCFDDYTWWAAGNGTDDCLCHC